MKKILFITLISLLALSSCQEVINIDTQDLPPKLVIEGLIDDYPEPDTIKLSYTTNWSDTLVRFANDASVVLSTDSGYSANLIHIGNGRYVTPSGFVGRELGSKYTVTVTQGGKSYVASSIMPRIYRPALDSVTSFYRKKEGFFEEGWYVKAYAHVFNDNNSYYLFKFYRNDSLLNKYEKNSGAGAIFVTENSQLNTIIDGIEIPYKFRLGDKARVEVYSISRDAYNFYNDLSIQINTDGGMFSAPPANVKGNWSNDALGFLQVSGRFTDTLTVK